MQSRGRAIYLLMTWITSDDIQLGVSNEFYVFVPGTYFFTDAVWSAETVGRVTTRIFLPRFLSSNIQLVENILHEVFDSVILT